MQAPHRILLAAALALAAPAVAEDAPYRILPLEEPLPLVRGTLLPEVQGARTVDRADTCAFVRVEWGWEECEEIDALAFDLVPGLDVLVVWRPAGGGFVQIDDWSDPGRHREIARIERERSQTLGEQSLRLGRPIEFRGWRAYPTLEADRRYLFYGHEALWDGKAHVMVDAALLDRRGYVLFQLVPSDPAIDHEGIERLIEGTLARYRAAEGEEYGAFSPGDPVAEAGALGLLAGLLGAVPPAAPEPPRRSAGWGDVARMLLLLAAAGLSLYRSR